MYRKFYQLTRNPFELSPDPHFFYPTQGHNEAMASLVYSVNKRKGFVVVTGEVGTGKTLLVRLLLDALQGNKISFAYIYNPRLTVSDFLDAVLNDFGFPFRSRTKSEALSLLNNYLLSRFRHGTTTALIVDEAHLLSWELLEEIRLLTNLETSQQKLLQIVLAGQPELDRKLDAPELRQLKQRIGLRCCLEPLGLEDSRGYIHRRLELAGSTSCVKDLFTDEAIVVIHEFAHGIPRLINTLCENSLVSGYGKQAKQITEELVREAAEHLRLNSVAVAPAPAANWESLETQKKALRMLARVMEEIGARIEGNAKDGAFDSGAERE